MKRRRLVPPEERANLAVDFGRLQELLGTKRVARQLGVPRSTLYRWLKKEKEKPFLADNAARRAEISIKVLTSNLSRTSPKFLDELFQFAVWLRWPTTSRDHDAAVLSCWVSYVAQKYPDARVLTDLPRAVCTQLLKRIPIATITRMLSRNAILFPFFDYPAADELGYNDRDALADICAYLLEAPHAQTNRRELLWLVRQGGFGDGEWTLSEPMFRAVWREGFPGLPFYYVEHAHTLLDFQIDPAEPDFGQKVDNLLASGPELNEFFSRAKWVTQALVAKLHRYTKAETRFLSFPAVVHAKSVHVSPLKKRVFDILHGAVPMPEWDPTSETDQSRKR